VEGADWLKTTARWLFDASGVKTKRRDGQLFVITLTASTNQCISVFRSSTNQRPPLFNQSTSAYFNVTFISKYHICSLISF